MSGPLMSGPIHTALLTIFSSLVVAAATNAPYMSKDDFWTVLENTTGVNVTCRYSKCDTAQDLFCLRVTNFRPKCVRCSDYCGHPHTTWDDEDCNKKCAIFMLKKRFRDHLETWQKESTKQQIDGKMTESPEKRAPPVHVCLGIPDWAIMLIAFLVIIIGVLTVHVLRQKRENSKLQKMKGYDSETSSQISGSGGWCLTCPTCCTSDGTSTAQEVPFLSDVNQGQHTSDQTGAATQGDNVAASEVDLPNSSGLPGGSTRSDSGANVNLPVSSGTQRSRGSRSLPHSTRDSGLHGNSSVSNHSSSPHQQQPNPRSPPSQSGRGTNTSVPGTPQGSTRSTTVDNFRNSANLELQSIPAPDNIHNNNPHVQGQPVSGIQGPYPLYAPSQPIQESGSHQSHA